MNQKITFPELVSAISESTGFSKYISEEFLKELFALVASKLVEGENTITITVTSSDGENKQVYTIIVTKEELDEDPNEEIEEAFPISLLE